MEFAVQPQTDNESAKGLPYPGGDRNRSSDTSIRVGKMVAEPRIKLLGRIVPNLFRLVASGVQVHQPCNFPIQNKIEPVDLVNLSRKNDISFPETMD